MWTGVSDSSVRCVKMWTSALGSTVVFWESDKCVGQWCRVCLDADKCVGQHCWVCLDVDKCT